MSATESLLPKHGGYKNLLSYQLAELILDITVLFYEKYTPFKVRTHDQMVQSGRSGFQNIAEGSVDSGVSKKSEIKLTGIVIEEGGITERMYRLRKEAREKAQNYTDKQGRARTDTDWRTR